nr:MAG TPA: hypothetical protein [Caudoviricetes sp.]
MIIIGTDIQADTKDKRGTFILMLNLQKKTYNIYKFRHFILTLAPK